MSQREASKGEQIRDEIRRKPCIDASEISEEYGVSPATVTRVVKNLDEDLKRMRQLRFQKHVDDLYDIEYDILWIVAHQPDATQAEVKAAYEVQADIPGFVGAHPETGDDAPDTVGDLWRDCLDSGWQGRTALANDLQDLLDEDRVSDAAEQAVAALETGTIEADGRPTSEPEEGTVRYMRYEVADAVGEDGEGRFLESVNRELRGETLKAAADVLDVGYEDGISRRDIPEKLAAEVGHPDVEFVDTDGRFPKPVIKDLRDAILEAVDDDEAEHECDVCGKEFDSPRALGGHKPCPERDDDLSGRQRDILEAVQEDPEAYQYEIADRVGTTQGQVSQAFHRLPYDWDEREEAAEDLLDQEDVDDGQAEEESQATEQDELSEVAERQLAIALENPDASARQVFHAEYEDRHGRQPGHDATMAKDLEDAHVENFREVAEEYFETHEKPNVSDVEVAETGTDLDEMLEDASDDDNEAAEMVRGARDDDQDHQDESDDELEGVACPGEAREGDDDVDLQEEPTDRDIEQADEAVEEILDEEDETPHVKNESGVDYEQAIEQLQLMHEHGIQADRVEIYNEEGETKFDANGVVLEG
jgi:DNA-binding Lrp family transcriptional regulator